MHGEVAIHRAAHHGKLESLNDLLRSDPQLLNKQAPRRAPFFYEHEDYANFNVGGCTPLMIAAYRNHKRIVARLLELGADLDVQALDGMTALHCACYGKNSKIAGRLIKAGAALNIRTFQFRQTPLMMAVQGYAGDCVKALLTHGGEALELDAQNKWGGTAMHFAALHGQVEAVRILLRAGANPAIRNDEGETPLDNALKCDKRYKEWGQGTSVLPLLGAVVGPRQLFKARTLTDAALGIAKARADGPEKTVAAAPACLKGRVERDEPLPRVTVEGQGDGHKQVAACLEYVLGLQDEAMPSDVFTELLGFLVPEWDPARKGMGLEEREGV